MKEGRGYLVDELLEEFRRDAVASRCFAFGHLEDGISDLPQGEIFSQLLIRFARDPGQGAGPALFPSFQGAGPALFPSFQGAGGVRFRGVETFVEGSNVVG